MEIVGEKKHVKKIVNVTLPKRLLVVGLALSHNNLIQTTLQACVTYKHNVKMGKQHWHKMLQHQYTPHTKIEKDSKNSKVKTSDKRESTRVSISGHDVASGMIGRRMFGFKARRRIYEAPTRQRTSRGFSNNAGTVAECKIIQVGQQNQQTLVVPTQESVSQQQQTRADTLQDYSVGILIPLEVQKALPVVLHPKNY